MKSIKLVPYLLILLLLLLGCGSDSGKKRSNTGTFPDYGLNEGDVIILEISSPGISIGSGSSGSTDTSGSTGAVTGTPGYQKTLTVVAGTTAQLSVVARDVSGNSYTDVKVTWASDNKSVATVDSTTGKVTGVSAGSATITAKLTMIDGTVINDSILVTVLPSPVGYKTWITADVKLPQPIWDHASAIWNGYIYVAGGNSSCDGNYQDCGFTKKISYARINQDGSIGVFNPAVSLPKTLRGHSMLAYNGYLYLIGGIVQPQYGAPPYPDQANFETILNEEVFYSVINPDGSIGEWIKTASLPPPEKGIAPEKAGLFAQSATVHNGYLYVTGGWSVALKKNVRNLLIGVINKDDGSILTWVHNPNLDLPYDLSKHVTVAVTVNGDNYLYIIGGNSGAIGTQSFHKEIYFAKIADDGIPNNWTLSSSFLPVQLIDHAATSAGRYIIVTGGRDGDDSVPHKIYPNVYIYFINNSGNLELLDSYTTTMPSPLFHHAAVADKNTATGAINIYVTGGAGGDTEQKENRKDSVYYLTEAITEANP